MDRLATVSLVAAQRRVDGPPRLHEKQPALGFRLPNEAEWEYACRAGTTGTFFWPQQQRGESYVWFLDNSSGLTRPVRQTNANNWGLHDMIGNVSEWTADWYAPNLAGGTDPTGPEDGEFRVHRGGSWSTTASGSRCAARVECAPSLRGSNIGFRIVFNE